MKERPILFSAPMIKALLAGTKTQTRRIMKLDAQALSLIAGVDDDAAWRWECAGDEDGYGGLCCGYNDGTVSIPLRCPYGAAGDRLWVRETWTHDASSIDEARAAFEDMHGGIGFGPYYRATEIAPDTLNWKPSIFMPRWASRITLEITDVRVQRLQEISEEDARAEGVKPFPDDPEGDCWTDGTHRSAFHYLWNEINGWNPDSWLSNPFVWCISFKRVEATP